MIRVLIVDDQQLVRKGLRSILAEGEMDVVGECEDGAQAVLIAEACQASADAGEPRVVPLLGPAA